MTAADLKVEAPCVSVKEVLSDPIPIGLVVDRTSSLVSMLTLAHCVTIHADILYP